MEPDLSHPYGLRAWLRQRLPMWLVRLGVADKGVDCASVGAKHAWYNADDVSSGCYYCHVRGEGQLWRDDLR